MQRSRLQKHLVEGRLCFQRLLMIFTEARLCDFLGRPIMVQRILVVAALLVNACKLHMTATDQLPGLAIRLWTRSITHPLPFSHVPRPSSSIRSKTCSSTPSASAAGLPRTIFLGDPEHAFYDLLSLCSIRATRSVDQIACWAVADESVPPLRLSFPHLSSHREQLHRVVGN